MAARKPAAARSTPPAKANLISIRPARRADAATIVRFNAALARETEGKRLDPARLLRGVKALLRDDTKGFYLLAEINGRIAGQLMITFEWSDWRDGNFWWIQSVFVAPRFRRRGVFQALYAEVERLAHRQGNVCGIRLYVERANVRAQITYKKLGLHRAHYEMFERDFALMEQRGNKRG